MMRDIITRTDLEAFGFAGARVLPAERIDVPAREDSEAAGLREAVVGGLTALPLLAGQLTFREIDSELLRQHGVSVAVLEQDQRFVRTRTAEPDIAMTVLEGGEEKRGHLQFDEDPGAVYWDTSQAWRLVARAEDRLVAVARDPGTGEFQVQIVVRPRGVPTLEGVAAPLEAWAIACDDRWLAERVRVHAGVGGSWGHAVAAGMYARLYEPPTVQAAASRVDAFMSGRPDAHFSAPREWIRSLDATQLQTIEDLGLSEVEALRAALDDLQQRLEPEPEAWIDDWRSVCHHRDDLEGVRVLLDAAGHGARMRDALAQLDRQGRRLLADIPRGLLADDEQSRRARLLDPTSWWSDPELADAL